MKDEPLLRLQKVMVAFFAVESSGLFKGFKERKFSEKLTFGDLSEEPYKGLLATFFPIAVLWKIFRD